MKMLDVFVMRGHWWNPVDAIIMHRSKSKYNHCGVIIKPDSDLIVDSTVGGVQVRRLSTDWKGYTYDLFRFKQEIPDERKQMMVNWLMKIVGLKAPYDYLSWLGFATGIEYFQDSDAWFCSELVAAMFEEVGYALSSKSLTFVFPSFFAESPLFEKVREP